MSPLDIQFTDAVSGMPMPGLVYTSFDFEISYIHPGKKLHVTFPKNQRIQLPLRLNVLVKVFGVNYFYGYFIERSSIMEKGKGNTVVITFGNLCYLLEKAPMDPNAKYSTAMTLGSVINLALSSWKTYNPDKIFSLAITSADVPIDATIHGKARKKRLIEKVAADDLQVRNSERILSWLLTILNRNAIHLAEYVGNDGFPILDIDAPLSFPEDFNFLPDYLITSGKGQGMITNYTSKPQVCDVIHGDEKINDEELPSCFIGFGHSFIPDANQPPPPSPPSPEFYQCGESLPTQLVGHMNTTSILVPNEFVSPTTYAPMAAEYKIIDMNPPDPYLTTWADRFVGLQNNYPVPIQSSDSPSVEHLRNKMTKLMRVAQYNAYSLLYTIHQPATSTMPVLPNRYVQVNDTDKGLSRVLWVTDVKMSFSKEQGFTQNLTLKIPNTFLAGGGIG